MSYGDRAALLDLVWQLRPDGAALLATVIPDSPPVLFEVTSFLMEQGDLPGARQAFGRLIELPIRSSSRANAGRVATAQERAHLGLDLTDLHLDRRDPASARGIWQSLERHGLTAVDGGMRVGTQIMNPRFRTEPLGRGFDWRVKTTPGVELRRVPTGLQVEMGGNHPPDRVPLLEQRVIRIAGQGVEIDSNAADWLVATVADESPGVGRLRIVYRRPVGRPPLRAPLVIREVRWRKF